MKKEDSTPNQSALQVDENMQSCSKPAWFPICCFF